MSKSSTIHICYTDCMMPVFALSCAPVAECEKWPLYILLILSAVASFSLALWTLRSISNKFDKKLVLTLVLIPALFMSNGAAYAQNAFDPTIDWTCPESQCTLFGVISEHFDLVLSLSAIMYVATMVVGLLIIFTRQLIRRPRR
jgi:hypothetical protein